MKVETITPNKAAEWLNHNPKNRKIRASTIERYAAAMKRGEWLVTHEGIAFNGNGDLIDGQHRLHACIQANTPFKAYVFRGMDSDSFKCINSGVPRKASDALHMQGHASSVLMAAALRVVYIFTSTGKFARGAMSFLTTQQILDLAEQHDIKDAIIFVANSGVYDYISPSISTAIYYLTHAAHPTLADDFFTKVGNGEGITRSDPEWLLRKQILEMRKSQHVPNAEIQAAYLVKAWNARKGKVTLKSIRWQSNEDFPALKL